MSCLFHSDECDRLFILSLISSLKNKHIKTHHFGGTVDHGGTVQQSSTLECLLLSVQLGIEAPVREEEIFLSLLHSQFHSAHAQ